jgi:hypothetical protein
VIISRYFLTQLSLLKGTCFESKFSPRTGRLTLFPLDAVARALLKPEATQNRYLFISSITTTQNEILAALEKHSEGPWKTTRVETRRKVEEANEMFKNGGDSVEAFKFLIMAVQYGANNGSDFSGKASNELLGLVQENLDDVVQRVIDA